MTPKNYFLFSMLALLSVLGVFIGGFTGGLLFGFAGSFLLAATVGKLLAKNAIQKINKILKDKTL